MNCELLKNITPCPLHRGSSNFFMGRDVLNTECNKGKYEAKLEVPGGGVWWGAGLSSAKISNNKVVSLVRKPLIWHLDLLLCQYVRK